MHPSIEKVHYGNGVVEQVEGILTFLVRIQKQDMPMPAYVLQGKGHSVIMGLTFLEENDLLVDCVEWRLTMRQ